MKKSLRDRDISHLCGPDFRLFRRASRTCGTVPQFRARLVWVSRFRESIAAVNELSNVPRLCRRESVNPASRWRLDLPGGGWM